MNDVYYNVKRGCRPRYTPVEWYIPTYYSIVVLNTIQPKEPLDHATVLL